MNLPLMLKINLKWSNWIMKYIMNFMKYHLWYCMIFIRVHMDDLRLRCQNWTYQYVWRHLGPLACGQYSLTNCAEWRGGYLWSLLHKFSASKERFAHVSASKSRGEEWRFCLPKRSLLQRAGPSAGRGAWTHGFSDSIDRVSLRPFGLWYLSLSLLVPFTGLLRSAVGRCW